MRIYGTSAVTSHDARMQQQINELKADLTALTRRLAKLEGAESSPETWQDVTAECSISEWRYAADILHYGQDVRVKGNGYRLRKVAAAQLRPNDAAFIIERKQP